MASMEEILKGSADKPVEPKAEPQEKKPEQEAAAETPETKPEEKAQEELSVSTEEKASKGEETAPPAVGKPDHTVPLAAHLDERDKRQRLERELADLKTAQEKPEEAPDFFDDPEAALKRREQAIDEKLLKNKLEMSQAMAMEAHPDFNEVLKSFNDVMEKDNALMGRGRSIWNESLSQPHPAEYVYKAVKRELALQEISDPDELRKKIEAEVRAELAKEKPDESIPESLADERSVGERSGPKWAGPTPLEKIIPST